MEIFGSVVIICVGDELLKMISGLRNWDILLVTNLVTIMSGTN